MSDQPLIPLKPGDRRRIVLAVVVVFVLLGLGILVGRWSAPTAAPAGGPAPAAPDGEGKPTIWTCSMHPQIRMPAPGQCPICGMDLIPQAQGGDDSRGPRALQLSPAAVALAEIETSPVARRSVSRRVRMVGKVDYDETRLKFITAWIPGRLDRLFVDYTGTLVRSGDHLVEIYSPQLLSAQEELIQALEARRRLEGGGSQLLQSTSRATVDSAREKLRLLGIQPEQIAEIERTRRVTDHLTIFAPTGGVVVHKNKNAGDYVMTGERIYTIADLDQVWVQLDAYESDLPWIRYGQTVRFEVESYPGQFFEGRVVFVDPVLTGNTRTVKVRLNVDNRDGRLKPGMFVRATLLAPLELEGQTASPELAGKWICPMHWEVVATAAGQCPVCGMALVPAEQVHRLEPTSETPPLVVPAAAVLWTGVRSLVYVRLPGDSPVFEGREVVLGPRAGDDYVVRSGLKVGELVVTRGSFKIDSAIQLEARPSMMLPPAGAQSVERIPVSAAFREAFAPVVDAYLALQTALAGDDLDAARGAAARLEQVRAIDPALVPEGASERWRELAVKLWGAAHAAQRSGTIDSARSAFYTASAALLEAVRLFGPPRGTLHEAFCPMAREGEGASWLQAGEEVQNPYFGASMLRCGELREAFRAGDPSQGARLSVPASALEQLGAVLRGYLDVQRALAEDDGARAKTAFSALGEAVGRVDMTAFEGEAHTTWMELSAKLRGAAGAGGASEALDAQRAAFVEASRALLEVERRFGHAGPTVVEVFCPMADGGKGAGWLQEGEEVRNPFLGTSMPRCGDVRGRHAPRAAPTSTGGAPPGRAPAPGPAPAETPPGHQHDAHPPDPATPRPAEQRGTGDAGALRRPLDPVLDAYFALQRDLAGDQATGATRADELRRALERLDASGLPPALAADWRDARRPALLADVQRLGAATDLAAQRQAFEALSRTLTAAVARLGHAPARTVRRFHCPMAFGNKGADWLQEGERTLNPYFGASMLRCGRQVEELPAGGTGGDQ